MQDFQDISNAVFSNNALGLTVAAIIFIVTIMLLIRKIIGVFLTLILLFFAIISGLAIAHNDIVREYLNQATKEKEVGTPTTKPEEGEDWETKFNNLKQHLLQKIEEIKNSSSKKD